jgi:hypothetical protein
MAKPEDFRAAAAPADDSTRDALLDGTYKPKATRVADPNYVQILPGTDSRANTGANLMQQQNQWTPPGSLRTETWPTSKAGNFPGPNPVQWNGGKPDVSRGPGGTVFQTRPDFDRRTQPVMPNPTGSSVAPIAIEATRGPTGRAEGPIILPDTTHQWTRPPADPGRDGGLWDRGDGTVVDQRSEHEKFSASLNLLGFVGGLLVGMTKGGWKGAAAGALIGFVGAELLKPLNPFK